MKKTLIMSVLLTLLIGGSSCVRLKKPEASDRHDQWLESLNDSIATYKAQADSISYRLTSLRNKTQSLINDFEYVSNPREVEGYYIYKGWKGHFPLLSTELVARISENEGLELIAALSVGVFNQISVSNGSATVRSAIVPHDQALNYRAGNINTVCFSGAQADSVAAFIADNKNGALKVNFLGGPKTLSLSLSPAAKDMIASSYSLYAIQKETHKMEKMLPLLSRKIDLCRHRLNEAENDSI